MYADIPAVQLVQGFVYALSSGDRRGFRFQHRHHGAAGKIRFREQHAFRALGGDGDAGTAEIAFSRIHRGQHGVEAHVHNFQTIAISLAEAHGDINIIAYDLTVQDIGKGLVKRLSGHAQRAVRGWESLVIRQRLLRIVFAEPLCLDLRHGAVLSDRAQIFAELIAQRLARFRLGEHIGELKVFHVFRNIGQSVFLLHLHFYDRLIHRVTIDFISQQGADQVSLRIEIGHFRIGQLFKHHFVKAGAGLHADALAVQLRKGRIFSC